MSSYKKPKGQSKGECFELFGYNVINIIELSTIMPISLALSLCFCLENIKCTNIQSTFYTMVYKLFMDINTWFRLVTGAISSFQCKIKIRRVNLKKKLKSITLMVREI